MGSHRDEWRWCRTRVVQARGERDEGKGGCARQEGGEGGGSVLGLGSGAQREERAREKTGQNIPGLPPAPTNPEGMGTSVD